MSLPYLQLDEEFIRVRAVSIAARLKVSRHEAVGMGADLFPFAVEATSTKERPPDGLFPEEDAWLVLEAGMNWTGEPGAAVKAFQRAGVLEPLDGGGLRVKGMERYRRTWEKNNRPGPEERRGFRHTSGKRAAGEVPETGKHPTGFAPGDGDGDGYIKKPLSAEPTVVEPPPSEKPDALEAEARDVFEHWRDVMDKGRRAVLDSARKTKVVARLRDGYSVAELKQAVDGCRRTPHNMGENEKRQRYDDLELICRDASHVDRFKAAATGPPDKPIPREHRPTTRVG